MKGFIKKDLRLIYQLDLQARPGPHLGVERRVRGQAAGADGRPGQRGHSQVDRAVQGQLVGGRNLRRREEVTDDLPSLPPAEPGRYRHYKGGEYELVGVARHSETLEPLVIYRPLYNASFYCT